MVEVDPGHIGSVTLAVAVSTEDTVNDMLTGVEQLFRDIELKEMVTFAGHVVPKFKFTGVNETRPFAATTNVPEPPVEVFQETIPPGVPCN
jgi:hypothetical protein